MAARDHAAFSAMIYAGLRIEETTALVLEDLSPAPREAAQVGATVEARATSTGGLDDVRMRFNAPRPAAERRPPATPGTREGRRLNRTDTRATPVLNAAGR